MTDRKLPELPTLERDVEYCDTQVYEYATAYARDALARATPAPTPNPKSAFEDAVAYALECCNIGAWSRAEALDRIEKAFAEHASSPQHSVTEQADCLKCEGRGHHTSFSERRSVVDVSCQACGASGKVVQPLASTAATQPSDTDLLQALRNANRLLRAAGFAMTGTCSSKIVAAINAHAAATQPEQASSWRGSVIPAERLVESLKTYAKCMPTAGRAQWAMSEAAKLLEARAALAIPASTAASEQQAGAVHQIAMDAVGGIWKDIGAADVESFKARLFTVRTLYAAPDIATTAADCHPSCGYIGSECDYPACKTVAGVDRQGAAQAQAGNSDGEIYARHAAGGLAADARDVARYRWLRDHGVLDDDGSADDALLVYKGFGESSLLPEQLDEAVDAAMVAPATSDGTDK